MSKCTDPQFSKMIHAYELGILSEDSRQRLEMHLMECDSCLEEVRAFLPASRLLRHDRTLRPTDDAIADTKVSQGDKSRIWKLLVVAALVVAVAVPVIKYMPGSRDGSALVQQLELYPMRTAGTRVLYLDVGGMADIQFVLEGAATDKLYHLVIRSRGGSVLFSDNSYHSFDSTGMGHVSLPVGSFEKDFYLLIISERSDDSLIERQRYNFRVE